MAKNFNKSMWLVTLGFLLIVGSVFAYLATTVANDSSDGMKKPKYVVECNLFIDDLVLGGIELKTADCFRTKRCSIFDSLAVFSQSGNARLIDSKGIIASENYDFIVFGSEELTISGCTSDTNLRVDITDEDNNIIDSKDIVVG